MDGNGVSITLTWGTKRVKTRLHVVKRVILITIVGETVKPPNRQTRDTGTGS